MSQQLTFNFNVGLVGHVDSGKTTLAKRLSTTSSTAAFDKNPQSQERGITLDLGFSSFVASFSQDVLEREPRFTPYSNVQFTLVDCPGHASLLRTVIGGASIIDAFILVIDIMKGVQTQTAECLIVAEITKPGRMIIVLNKIDLIPENDRQKKIDVMVKRLRKTLQVSKNTGFAEAPIIPIAASSTDQNADGIKHLIGALLERLYFPNRSSQGPFLFNVDHCFSLRGQGTVMTGTVLQGSVAVGGQIEIPALADTRKVKSMQQFRKPINKVLQGDRVGICVAQFDANLLERGIICTPGALPRTMASICSVKRISFFKTSVPSKSKMHISVGHDTVMAKCTFFEAPHLEEDLVETLDDTAGICEATGKFDMSKEYEWADSLRSQAELRSLSDGNDQGADGLVGRVQHGSSPNVLLEFEHPVLCPPGALYIASKLDTDIHTNTCRIGFYGHLMHSFTDKDYRRNELPLLKVYKTKTRSGVVERMLDDYTVIAHGLFKKETNLELFNGLKVALSSGEDGIVEGGFGQSGKVKIRIPSGLNADTSERLEAQAASKKKRKGANQDPSVLAAEKQSIESLKVVLEFKKYVFDDKKKIKQ